MRLSQSIILLCIPLLFMACGGNPTVYVIGVSQCSDDEWRQKMNSEILTEALFYDNLQVEILSANDDNETQISQIRYFIDKGVDLLVVAPNEAIPITSIVEEAYGRGIPVIIVDRKILSDSYSTFIGADNYSMGKTIGEYIAAKLGGAGRVVQLTGLLGSTPAVDRSQGFMNIIRQYPDLELLTSVDAAWSRSTAERVTDSLLSLYPRIDLIFAHNDRMAYGAYLSARKFARENSIAFIGIDAVPGRDNGLELVLENILDATFIYPTGGDRVVRTAMDLLQGKSVPREIILGTAVVDRTNARIMELQTNEIIEQQKKISLLNSRMDSNLLRYSTLRSISYGVSALLLVIIALLAVVGRSLLSQSRLNRQLRERNREVTSQKEQIEQHRDRLIELSRQLEDATQAKLMFFTNISHDFRTPLTLISDPVMQLLSDEGLSESHKFNLRIMKRNIDVLLKLVDQILDFRKYENGKLTLNLSEVDLLEAMKGWNNSFMPAVRNKQIRFTFNSGQGSDFRVNIDREKIERCYFNLLSNALKFTPSHGRISVDLSWKSIAERWYVSVSVCNSDSYITSDQLPLIFDRFYTVNNNRSGSGIGLALTKAFVELHDGQIDVQSDPLTGTVFTIDLPSGNMPTAAPQTEASAVEGPDDVEFIENEEQEAAGNEKPTVLLIDDNDDIRRYIKRILSSDYNVIEADDGRNGILMATRYLPDIIVSDIMMPNTDGIECCQFLKQDTNTSHIPVILLTACSLDEQRIEAFESGADGYISKPFNSGLLRAMIRNLLDKSDNLERSIRDNIHVKKTIPDDTQDLYEQFCSIVEEKMDDPHLNVETIGRELGVNRVQLYRKIKSATNYSPVEYLRISRLKRAARLLVTTDMTISEVAYIVGFGSPSYFTKCFREHYGESPLDYIRKVKK